MYLSLGMSYSKLLCVKYITLNSPFISRKSCKTNWYLFNRNPNIINQNKKHEYKGDYIISTSQTIKQNYKCPIG